MDTSLVKFLILWIICENVVLTTSMALNSIANEDANRRQKRSPANNFSLFGFNVGNPVSAARESFGSIGNIFSGSRRNTHHNNYHEPIEHYGNMRNTNTLSQIEFPNRNDVPNAMAHNDFQKEDRYIWPQENKSEGDKKTVPDKKQNFNTKTVPEINNRAPENAGDYTSNGKLDKQVLDYIFQNSQRNYDSTETTVDNSIDYVTETGDIQTTTDDFNRILPQAAVASLLG